MKELEFRFPAIVVTQVGDRSFTVTLGDKYLKHVWQRGTYCWVTKAEGTQPTFPVVRLLDALNAALDLQRGEIAAMPDRPETDTRFPTPAEVEAFRAL